MKNTRISDYQEKLKKDFFVKEDIANDRFNKKPIAGFENLLIFCYSDILILSC